MVLKRNLLLVLLSFGLFGILSAQIPQVPSEMEFADLTLKITDGARKEIQTHVNAFYRSEKYFKIKLDRINLYFPIIEKIFKEEHLPDDFKYLVIQESALISDAVSSSNAVGFWQFKKASGEEVGLRIDGIVDERLNIVSSTRGAARYLKRNNHYFDNWLYALLAYNMGAGGAQQEVEEKYFGAKKMEINKRTHWYIMKFLAHKVAFENAIGREPHPELSLAIYTGGANKSLKQIAAETNVDSQLLKDYNKWLKRGNVPDDKTYAVIIPGPPETQGKVLALNEKEEEVRVHDPGYNANPSFNSRFSKGSDKYPIIEGKAPMSNETSVLVTVNGKPGIIAGQNDNLLTLAEKGDVSISRFLRFNDLDSDDQAIAGQVYYLKSKRGRAPEHYHVVQESENMWSISQKYGIKLRKLRRKNRMEEGEQPKPGRVLWMRFVRPADEPIEYRPVENADALATKEEERKAVEVTPESGELIADTEVATVITNEAVAVPANVGTLDEESGKEKTTTFQEATPQEEEVAEVPAPADNNLSARTEGTSFGFNNEVEFVETSPLSNKANNIDVDGGTHVVKQGETLYGISRDYGIKLGNLLYWNNLSLKDEIKTGQVLKVTPPIAETSSAAAQPLVEEEQFIIHEVTKGETMYKIARDHNVTIKDVMQWNNKEDFNVSIGEKLRIKKRN